MAIYDNTEYIRCTCGNATFYETEEFMIEKHIAKNLITKDVSTIKTAKRVITKCSACNKTMGGIDVNRFN